MDKIKLENFLKENNIALNTEELDSIYKTMESNEMLYLKDFLDLRCTSKLLKKLYLQLFGNIPLTEEVVKLFEFFLSLWEPIRTKLLLGWLLDENWWFDDYGEILHIDDEELKIFIQGKEQLIKLEKLLLKNRKDG